MTPSDQPARRLDVDAKRILFVAVSLWAAFHLFGLAMFAFAGSASPLGAALFLDAYGGLIAGLWWAARRVFPKDGDPHQCESWLARWRRERRGPYPMTPAPPTELVSRAHLAEEIAAALEADVAYFDTPADCQYATRVARDHAQPKETR